MSNFTGFSGSGLCLFTAPIWIAPSTRDIYRFRAAILEARSLRLTDIAVKMEGENATSNKRIQHFLGKADPRTALWRLFQEDWNPLFCLAKPNKDSPGKLF
jgi:hypothetical protein